MRGFAGSCAPARGVRPALRELNFTHIRATHSPSGAPRPGMYPYKYLISLSSLKIGGSFLQERGGALDLVLGRHEAGLAEPFGHHARLGAEF